MPSEWNTELIFLFLWLPKFHFISTMYEPDFSWTAFFLSLISLGVRMLTVSWIEVVDSFSYSSDVPKIKPAPSPHRTTCYLSTLSTEDWHPAGNNFMFWRYIKQKTDTQKEERQCSLTSASGLTGTTCKPFQLCLRESRWGTGMRGEWRHSFLLQKWGAQGLSLPRKNHRGRFLTLSKMTISNPSVIISQRQKAPVDVHHWVPLGLRGREYLLVHFSGGDSQVAQILGLQSCHSCSSSGRSCPGK